MDIGGAAQDHEAEIDSESPSQVLDGNPNEGLCEIAVAWAMVSIPLAIFSVGLMGIVLCHRIDTTSSSHSLDAPSQDIPGSYIVDMSATTIALISSYSSTIAPIAFSFAMTLFSYVIANDIRRYSTKDQSELLPTPYQVGLLITLKSGTIGSLWAWFKYTFQWRLRSKTSPILRTFTIGLASVLLLTFHPKVPELTADC